MSILLTSVTGNIGSKLSQMMLKDGINFSVLVRHPEKVNHLAEKGINVIQGDYSSSEDVQNGLKGIETLFLLIPPHYTGDFLDYYKQVISNFKQGIINNNVKNVVTISSVGADYHDAGIVEGLHIMENEFSQLEGVNIIHLRAGYFMENLLGLAGLAKHQGIIGSPIAPDLSFAAVATQDIAEKAFHFIKNGFEGKQVNYVLGPKDYTFPELIEALKKEVKLEQLPYIQFGYKDFENNLKGFGFSEEAALRMSKLNKFMNEGLITSKGQRNEATSTPTSIEDFAKIWAHVYQNS